MMQLEKQISEVRRELDRLIEIRDLLSELVLEVSQRLDLLIVEHIKEKGR